MEANRLAFSYLATLIIHLTEHFLLICFNWKSNCCAVQFCICALMLTCQVI